MKRTICLLLAFILCIAALPVLGQPINIHADPNSNVNNPELLPYLNKSFSFKNYTNTLSIKAPADGNVTVTLTDTKLSINKTVTCSIKARYWDGTYWRAVTISPQSFTVTNTANTYTFTVSGLPANSSFYVGMSKSDYTGYAVKGKISVTD